MSTFSSFEKIEFCPGLLVEGWAGGREGDLIEPSVDVLDVGNLITRSPPNKDHFTLLQR